LDTEEIKLRLQKFEDPISAIHEKVPQVSKIIYYELKSADCVTLSFPDDFYINYSRVLAALEKRWLIKLNGILGTRIPYDLKIVDPAGIGSESLFRIVSQPDRLAQTVENGGPPAWLTA